MVFANHSMVDWKKHSRHDILLQRDTPIFSTSKDELSFIRGGVVDDRETPMMKVRWPVVSLFNQTTRGMAEISLSMWKMS